jgi:hypothetical protein
MGKENAKIGEKVRVGEAGEHCKTITYNGEGCGSKLVAGEQA